HQSSRRRLPFSHQRREPIEIIWNPHRQTSRTKGHVEKPRIVRTVIGHDERGVVPGNLVRQAKHLLRGVPANDARIAKVVLVLELVEVPRNRRVVRTGEHTKRGGPAQQEGESPAASRRRTNTTKAVDVNAADPVGHRNAFAWIKGKKEQVPWM